MNFKIITYSKTEICLNRNRNEEGGEIVRITAFINNPDGAEPILKTIVKFSDVIYAQCFVGNYSGKSAK